jgi:hypothetical protein
LGDRIEQGIIEALNVTRVDSSQVENIDLGTAAAAVRDYPLLQKGPVRTVPALVDGSGQSESVSGAPILRKSASDAAATDPKLGVQTKPSPADRPVPAPSPLSKKPEVSKADEEVEEGPLATVKEDDVDKLDEEQALKQDSDTLEVARQDTPHSSERPVAKAESRIKQDTQPTTEQVQTAKQKVVEHIEELAATRKNGRVTIKLSPDDLGTITLAVRSLGNEIETKVTASNENVRHALQAHRAELVQSVESRGLSMNSFTVGSEAPQDQAHQRQDQPNRQDFARSHNLWAHKNETQAKPTFARLSHAGVDTLA